VFAIRIYSGSNDVCDTRYYGSLMTATGRILIVSNSVSDFRPANGSTCTGVVERYYLDEGTNKFAIKRTKTEKVQ